MGAAPSEVRGDGSPVAGAARGCELSKRCQELNSGPQKEQSVLLTGEPRL